ncbi:hypothetical protein HUG20_01330 [Salicibibacter cibi]|uniref:Uncharacterized protein n=1 Tax=Salicibibacter cibi TaxID=2743001 RepID=A0A7T6Z827_9BACI|nr:hypothetical protein [Salicibibacter cibi]QQK78676.1 hypothetical protein HUG20_01330 [Salicibibacter cibi]
MSWDIFFIGFVYMSVFLFADKIIPTNKIRRKQWMSFSGGLAVSYVFVYLLPTLHDQQAMIHEEYGRLAMQSELYFVGLIGLILFFSIQKYADHVHKSTPGHDTDKENNDALFWLEESDWYCSIVR